MTSVERTARVSRASVGLRSERGPVLGSVMLAIGLVAIDSTILATAVPAIVADVGGFTQFPWLFSAYLLAQAVSTPLAGKLADLHGRKPVMLAGIGLFLLGSLLCALAWNMGALIAFRAVQGLGAGAIQPTGMTIVGDLYSVAERATVQGYVASVWAASAVVGPTLGGVFADYLSWRWIFLVNLPLGAAATWMLLRSLREQAVPQRRPIDRWGSVLLSAGAVLLLLGLLEGGIRWAWASPTSLVVLGGAAALLVAFVLVERRAPEPVLPLWLFRSRVQVAGTVGSLVVGVLTLGLSSYVPLYAQSVLGTGAVVGGLALAAMTIGWPVAASTAGRFYLRWGFRATLLMGAAIGVLGSVLLALVGPDTPGSPVLALAGACLVIGLGLGYVASPAVVAVQSAVPWQQRGVATGTNMFARSVGSAVGVAAFGAVVNGVLAARLGEAAAASVDVETLSAGALEPAVRAVFVASAFVAAALVVAGLVMPSRVAEPAPDDARA